MFLKWRTSPSSLKTKAFQKQAKEHKFSMEKFAECLKTHFSNKELRKMHGAKNREVGH